jgi:hypothetical protein
VVVVVGGSVGEVVLVEVVVDEVRFEVVVVARFAAGFPPPCEHAVATKATTPMASITVTPGRRCRPWNCLGRRTRGRPERTDGLTRS